MGVIRVGEYEFNDNDRIGQGGFGTVYKGRKSSNPSDLVAIKAVNKAAMFAHADLVEKEITILRQLRAINHPNLVAMKNCIKSDSRYFIIMEYCNGGDFDRYLQAKRQLSESTIQIFLRQLANGMSVIHSKGIVHRDIKPQNILLTHRVKPPSTPKASDFTLKIADFGISKFLGNGSMARTNIGTPAYMAPEILIGLKYDFKADLWSLGVTIYQSLTNNFPFKIKSMSELRAMYESNANSQLKLPAGTSQELTNLLKGLLQVNPNNRMSLKVFYKHPFLHQAKIPAKSVGVRREVPAPKSPLKDGWVTAPLGQIPHGAIAGGVDKKAVGHVRREVPAPKCPPKCGWVNASQGQIPHGAIAGGIDITGETMYVARAEHMGATLPGKLVPSHGCAYVPWGGKEHRKRNYQVLTKGQNQWCATNGSHVPANAFPGGVTEDGEKLYIGRVRHQGAITIGKVQRSHGVCYIPYDGVEYGCSRYEILI